MINERYLFYLSTNVSGDRHRSVPINSYVPSPSNAWFEAGETSITAHWQLPPTAANADFCIISYKAEIDALTVRIPVSKDERHYSISGLLPDQLYEIQLYCVYNGHDGNSTQTFQVSTRTLSTNPSVCPGSLPNAALEPYCLTNPTYKYCDFTCLEGYRASHVPEVIHERRWEPSLRPITLACREGKWVTRYEDYGFSVANICLPEADFNKCPATIPHGKLEPVCGPDTDWLCEFECEEGYYKHAYMSGILKNFFNREYMLYCDKGIFKTGYEHLGVDVSKVCVPPEPNCTNDNDIPHGKVPNLPCPSGYTCGFNCDEGYRKHALAWDNPSCSEGEWILRTTKYDPTLTPENMCIREDEVQNCPRNIAHGRITSDCLTNCYPECDPGFKLPRSAIFNGPGPITCENGKWLTDEAPYNGDNVCFPVDGHECPLVIENGISSTYNDNRFDDGASRSYIPYKCNDGFRKHRSVKWIECVAGKWVTWQERFGINTSSICIPYHSSL